MDKSLTKTAGMSLGEILTTSNSSTAIVRHVKNCDPIAICESQTKRCELLTELAILRRKYKEFKNINIREGIAAKAKIIKSQLESIEEYQSIGASYYTKRIDIITKLMKLILHITDQFNLKSEMNLNARQIETTAEMIVNNYPYLYLEDISVCFHNALAGEYGKVYDRLDPSMILEWVRLYNQFRTELIQAKNESRHLQQKIPIQNKINEKEKHLHQIRVQAMTDKFKTNNN